METIQPEQQEAVNKVYNYAADLFLHQKKNAEEVREALMRQGLEADSATIVVENLEQQIADAKKKRANKDMLYGALWCIGGIVATAANIGFIFWGAIIFGGIQFFRGLANQ